MFSLVLSCKKDNNSNSGSSGGTTTTSGSCGSASFEANGVTRPYNNWDPAIGACSTGIVVQSMGTTMLVEAALHNFGPTTSYNNGRPDYTLVAGVTDVNNEVTTGTYTADPSVPYPHVAIAYYDYPPGQTIIYYNIIAQTGQTNGTITFTDIDYVNQVVSGTFSGTLYENMQQVDSVVITNGTFQDIPFTIM